MLRCAVLGLVLSTLFFSGLAQAQTGSIRVQVNGHREVHGDGKPPGDVAVTDMETREDTIRELSPNGRADFGNLKDGNYIVTVHTGDRTGTTYVRVVNGRQTTAEISAGGLPTSTTYSASPTTLAGQARTAIDNCDRAAYDRAALELARDEAMLEINLRDLRAIGASTLPTQRLVEGRLNGIKAARQSLPPYPQPCGKTAAAPPPPMAEQVALVQFLLSPELALIFANRPQTSYFRKEVAGIITKLGAFKPDDTDTGVKFGMSAGIRWDSNLLGTKQLGIEAKIWYVDYNIKDSGEVTADPGGTIGLFSPPTSGNPFGGYSTGGPLTNGSYESKVEQFGGEVQVQTWYSSGNFRAMPWFGVRVGRTTVDEDIKFDIGMPVITTFEQRNDIKDTYVGPTIGLKARYDISGGVYGFAEGSLGLEYHKGKGDWQTQVPLVEADPRKDKLSNTKWGISAGLKAGLGFEAGAFGLQFGAGVNYTNASPYLKFKEADSTTTGTGGADIGYGSQREYLVDMRGTYRF
jgi:hypothetical protein